MDHLKAPALPQTAFSSVESNVDCALDPIASLKTMFVDIVQKGRIASGQCPALRPVFLKPHGVAAARFRILDHLPAHCRVGLFSEPGRTFEAWVRFSSDTLPSRPDFKTTLGIGIMGRWHLPGRLAASHAAARDPR